MWDMNKYERVIYHEIIKNQTINVRGLREIICDNPKYANRMGTPTLLKYIKTLHEDGYTNLREIKNQKFYSAISDSGFRYDAFIKKLDTSYIKLEKNLKTMLRRVKKRSFDKKLQVNNDIVNLLFTCQNMFQISERMSENRISSNSFNKIEKKFKNLLIYVIDQIDPDIEFLILKNFEKNLIELAKKTGKN